MLPKSKRLTKEDFSESRPKVFYKGEMFDSAFFSHSNGKCACVISKKTFKKAVDRNLVRRRILSIVKELPLYEKKSLLIYPKKISKDVPYSQLRDEIVKAFATLR